MTLADRFWSKVAVRRHPNGAPDYGPEQLPADHAGRYCWPWLAAKRGGAEGDMYGAFSVDGRMEYAHRIAYWLFTGRRIRKDRDGCHTCDFGLCCNPTHVTQGTHRQNMAAYIARYGAICVSKRPAPPRPRLHEDTYATA